MIYKISKCKCMRKWFICKSLSRIHLAMMIIVILLVGHHIYIKGVEKKIQDDYQHVLNSHEGEAFELEEFPILKQKYVSSCSIAMICSVKGYYGEIIDEDTFMENHNIHIDKTGMSPKDVQHHLQQSFNDSSVEMKENINDSEVLRIIINQLEKGIPIPIFYSTVDITNMTRFGTHYSTVIGINIDKKLIKIANVYGYVQELSIEEFLQYLKHSSKEMKTNNIIKFAKGLGVIKNNTLYVIDREL